MLLLLQSALRRRRPLSVVLCLVAAVPAAAQTPPLPQRPLHLSDCLALGQERQPSLAVARSQLAAAQSKLAALESFGALASCVNHGLPVRIQQARLGVQNAQAELARLEIENRYVITRAYLSVLYARAQHRALDDLIEDLTYLRQRVQTSVEKKDRPEWTAATLDLVTLYLQRAMARRAEADRGIALAVAALREGINVDPLVKLTVADEPIPEPKVQVNREEVLAAAVARRSEAVESSLVSEAAALETDAQARSHRAMVHTFAAGMDLHSRHVPQPIYGETFRPGGVPMSMPSVLAGPRAGRVETAQELSVQAQMVAQKTHNLIILEAEEAYFNWQEWSQKVVFLREAHRVGQRLEVDLRKEYRGPLKRVIDALLPENLLAAQAQTDYNEALYQQAIALAGLERVTGGAFCAGLACPPPPETLPK